MNKVNEVYLNYLRTLPEDKQVNAVAEARKSVQDEYDRDYESDMAALDALEQEIHEKLFLKCTDDPANSLEDRVRVLEERLKRFEGHISSYSLPKSKPN